MQKLWLKAKEAQALQEDLETSKKEAQVAKGEASKLRRDFESARSELDAEKNSHARTREQLAAERQAAVRVREDCDHQVAKMMQVKESIDLQVGVPKGCDGRAPCLVISTACCSHLIRHRLLISAALSRLICHPCQWDSYCFYVSGPSLAPWDLHRAQQLKRDSGSHGQSQMYY